MARCRHNPSLLERSGLRPLMRRDLEHRLAHVETLAQAMSRVDRQAADHRQVLRGSVVLRQFIRERLRVLGINPALAKSLPRGDEAAAELAAIPDTPELRGAAYRFASAIITLASANSSSRALYALTGRSSHDAAHEFREKFARMEELYP